jgi:hypothetical protein
MHKLTSTKTYLADNRQNIKSLAIVATVLVAYGAAVEVVATKIAEKLIPIK